LQTCLVQPRFQKDCTAVYDVAAMYGKLLLFALFAVPVLAAQAPPAAVPQGAEDHLNRAKRYAAEQKTDLAIAELKQVVKLDPSNIEARGNLGVLLYFHGDYAGAVPELRATVQAQPELWKIRALLGMAEDSTGDQTTARDDLEAAFPHLADEKVRVDAGKILVDLYSNAGDLEKAASIVSTLLVSRPADSSLLYLSYRIHSDLANRAILSMAIADPGSAEIHFAMARELAKQSTAQAIVEYREAIRINPKLPGAHTELGNLLFRSLDDKLQASAASEFQAALDANPRDEKAELALGVLAARRGDLKAAYTADAHALQLDPNDTDACTELAKVLIQMDKNDEAEQLLDRAIQIDPANYVAHFRLSTLYRHQGKIDEAKRQAELYLRYKQMREKLEKVIQDMRVASEQDTAGQDAAGKP
jgi:tetratricopeptide (TPR) repeat protein